MYKGLLSTKNVFFLDRPQILFLGLFLTKRVNEKMSNFRRNPSTNRSDYMPNFVTFLNVCFDCQ